MSTVAVILVFASCCAAQELNAVNYLIQGLLVKDRSGCSSANPLFELSTRLHPGYSAAWLELGRCKGKLGLHSQKIAAFEKAVAADPNHAVARYELGLAYHFGGQTTRAEEVARELQVIDPALGERLRNTVWLVKVDSFEIK